MRRAFKIILSLVCLCIFLCLVLLAVLPTWISSSSGTKTVEKWIDERIHGKLEIGKIEISWLGKQRLENVSWFDEKNRLIFSLQSLETDTSLLYLALGGRSLNRTVIESPYLFLSEEITEKLQKEQEKKNKKKKWRSLLTFNDSLLVDNGTLILASKLFSPITISQIDLEKEEGNAPFHLSAKTIQGQQEGSIFAQATFGKKIEATAKIVNFPVATLNGIEGTPLYTDAFGPALSLDLHLEKEGDQALTIQATAQSANLSAHIEGTTTDHQFSLNPNSNLDFTLTPALFKDLIDEKERKEWDLASKTQLKVQVEKAIFPMPLTRDRFKEIALQAQFLIERAELHHQQVGSYSLNHFAGSITAHQEIALSYSGEIVGKEKTELSGTISMTPEKEIVFQSDCRGFPVSLLALVFPSLEKNISLLLGRQFDGESRGTYQNGKLDTQVVFISPQGRLKAHLEGDLPQLQFETSGTLQIPPARAKVIGKEIDFTGDGKLDLSDDQLFIPFFKGDVTNPYLSFSLRGKAGEKGAPFSPETVQLIATGVIKPLPMQSLENTNVYLQVDGPKNTITIKAEGTGLNASVDMTHFIRSDSIALDQADVTFSAQLENFPLDTLSPFISETTDLSTFFGKTISMKAAGSYTPLAEPRFKIDLDAQGEGLRIVSTFSLDGTLTVQKNNVSYIYWELTPERYQALIEELELNPSTEPTFTLTRPTAIELDITEFTCPTPFPQDLNQFLCQSGFIGNIRLGTSVFRSKWNKEKVIFQEVTGSIKGANFSQGIDFTLRGDIIASNIPSSEKSSFSFEGQMLNFWTPEGHFNRQGLTVKGILDLNLLPVPQITGLVPLDHETRAIVQAVLGELLNARIQGEISHLSGPLTIEVKASNFKALLPLRLDQNVLYLREPVNAEITLTEAVNETLLKDMNPLFIAGAYSDHPLKLFIDPQGFRLPIHPYSLQHLSIGRAVLDIGKIRVRNGGQVQYLVKFLKAQELSQDGLMEAWFTPIYFNLQDGVATYNRFDALLGGNIHIAMWGKINLINNHVSMTLGISPGTIAQRFKISGLGKQSMFQVTMKGTTDHLDLDWSSASTRIAFLVAKSAGGQIGQLIGGLLEPLIHAALGEEPVPQPTTHPFPWEK